MRYIGIDYGSKRVGVAVSDEAGRFAMPREVLANDSVLVGKVASLVKELGAHFIVLGESKDYKGKDNAIMEKIGHFKRELEALDLEVRLEPEFMTSVAAERFQGKNEFHDASAAALILQSYLDRKRVENDEDLGE